MQKISCPNCQSIIRLGDPLCSNCGEELKYNCTVCGFYVNNNFSYCPNCATRLNWNPVSIPIEPAIEIHTPVEEAKDIIRDEPVPIKQYIYESEKSNNSSFTRWITLAVLCIVLIIVILIIDRLLY